MSNGVIRLVGFWLLTACVSSCSSTNESKVCNGGCLCFTTPNDCSGPGCYPTYLESATGEVTFICSNSPVPDAGLQHVPANHRVDGTACPQERGESNQGVGIMGSQDGSAVVLECAFDSDCLNGTNGRCLSAAGPSGSFSCSYDECSSDSDCSGNVPCGCRSSTLSAAANNCATESNCRVDADCGLKGFCSPSLVNKQCQCQGAVFCTPSQLTQSTSCNGNCGHGYFCHTPKDSCLDDRDCGTGNCSYDLTSQAWVCTSVCIGPL